MERHSANAQAVAIWLHEHPKVLRVNYPGLASHPHHDLARRQMREFGGMVSFELRGGEAAAKRMAARTEIFTLGESLGGVESLIEVPLPMTHAPVRGTKLQPPGLGLWALELRANREFLGQVGLFPVEGKGPEVEIAYELAPRAWGRGYATEAARALVEYGLRELGLARIVALILPDNVRSRHVAEKAAMRLAGPARHYGLDLLKYAIGADSGPTLAT